MSVENFWDNPSSQILDLDTSLGMYRTAEGDRSIRQRPLPISLAEMAAAAQISSIHNSNRLQSALANASLQGR